MNGISNIKPYQAYRTTSYQDRNSQADGKKLPSPTLQGVLLNKSREDNCFEPNSSLIITTPKDPSSTIKTNDENVKSFDVKKALAPLLIGTIGLFGAIGGLSMILRYSAKTKLKTDTVEHLRDLAVNMNIEEEPHFATYMMLRTPNVKTIKAAIGVFVMSGITLVSKNFVDGIKQIWTKKQESDIERDLQENLIETETKVFSGKLQIERNMLAEKAQYFDKVFNQPDEEKFKGHKSFNAFKNIQNFCAKTSEKKPKRESKNKENNFLYAALLAGTAILSFILGKMSFKNLKKASDCATKYVEKTTETAVDAVNELAKENTPENISKIGKIFEAISAKSEVIDEFLKKINVPEEKIQEIIKNVENTRKSIYANAPETFAGVTSKIQYYCYLNEDRGHLYNALMHPENKFTKYIFIAFSTVSAIGYITEQCVEAIKNVAVSRENSKTELSLQKRLIEVELKNFESKKNSAINPLIEEFNKKLRTGAPEENLKTMADNILMEIKNGAPFVYT